MKHNRDVMKHNRDVRTMLWLLRYKLAPGEEWVELENLKSRLRRHDVRADAVEAHVREAHRRGDSCPYFHVRCEDDTLWVAAIPARRTNPKYDPGEYSPTSPGDPEDAEEEGELCKEKVVDSDDDWGAWPGRTTKVDDVEDLLSPSPPSLSAAPSLLLLPPLAIANAAKEKKPADDMARAAVRTRPSVASKVGNAATDAVEQIDETMRR